MEFTLVINLFVILLFLIGLGFTAYLYFRERTLGEIRADVYKLFLEAEHTYTETESGKQKMEYVIQRARSMLPKRAQLFITEEVLNAVSNFTPTIEDGTITWPYASTSSMGMSEGVTYKWVAFGEE